MVEEAHLDPGWVARDLPRAQAVKLQPDDLEWKKFEKGWVAGVGVLAMLSSAVACWHPLASGEETHRHCQQSFLLLMSFSSLLPNWTVGASKQVYLWTPVGTLEKTPTLGSWSERRSMHSVDGLALIWHVGETLGRR